MNKSELVAAIAKDTGVTKKDIEAVLKSLTTAIHTELNAGGKVQIPELGSFKVSERDARTVRNTVVGAMVSHCPHGTLFVLNLFFLILFDD